MTIEEELVSMREEDSVLCELWVGLFRRNGPTISRSPPASAQRPGAGIPQSLAGALTRFDHDAGGSSARFRAR